MLIIPSMLDRLASSLRFTAFDTSTSDGRQRERERRMLLTSAASGLARVVGTVTQLIAVPLLLGYLGRERYGVWLTILSATQWLGMVQLGVAPSLLNSLSSAQTPISARQAVVHQQRLVSTAFWMQAGLAAFVLLVFAAVASLLRWDIIFNVESTSIAREAGGAVSVTVLFLALQLTAGLSYTIHKAHQEGYLSSLWLLLGHLLGLAGTIWIIHTSHGLIGVALVAKGGPILATVLAFLVLWSNRPHFLPSFRHVTRDTAKSLLSVGLHFVIVSISSMVIISTDNIVITQMFGPRSVTPYAITFMVTQLVLTFAMVVLDALWPAYSEAASRGDVTWIRKTHRRVSLVFFVTFVLFGASLALLGRPLIGWWAGDEAVPSFRLLLALIGLMLTRGAFMSVGRLVTALGAVHVTARVGFINAAINLPASILLASTMGLPGVAFGTILGYGLSGWLLFPVARRELRRIETQTWSQRPQAFARHGY